MKNEITRDYGFKDWMRWCAFVGFLGLGLLFGSTVYILTVKLNPQLADHFIDLVLLFLYTSLFYGVLGAAAGALLGILLWRFVSPTRPAWMRSITRGVVVTVLLVAPLAWALSTSTVSVSLYALKGKLLLSRSLAGLLGIVGLLVLFFALGSFIARRLARVRPGIGSFLAVYLVFFIATAVLVRGFGGKGPGVVPSGTVDYSIRGTGIKFIVVGLDCADLDIIEPLAAAGKLPTMARLMREGVTASLGTLIPTLTPSLWTSISTGTGPETHGIRNFYVTSLPAVSTPIRLFPGGFGLNFRIIPLLNESSVIPPLIKMNTSNMKARPDIWDIFTRFGRKVGIIDYMITWPADRVEGFILSDLLLRYVSEFGVEGIGASEGLLFPEEMGGEVKEILAGIDPEDISMSYLQGRILPPDCGLGDDNAYVKLLERKLWRDECLWKLSRELYGKHRPDFFMNYTSAIDGTNHLFKDFIYRESGAGEEQRCFGDILAKWYGYEDARIGELMALADENTCVIIISDHGWDEEKGHHEHGPRGTLIMWGRGVKKGVRLDEAVLLDFAPTVLALSGYPVARDMEGKVLEKAVSEELLASFPVRYIDSYGGEAVSEEAPVEMDPVLDKQMREELEALGYIK
jgi:hypothetical protein